MENLLLLFIVCETVSILRYVSTRVTKKAHPLSSEDPNLAAFPRVSFQLRYIQTAAMLRICKGLQSGR